MMQGRESQMPPLEVGELSAACAKGAYNSCIDLAVQVRCARQAGCELGRSRAGAQRPAPRKDPRGLPVMLAMARQP